MRESDQSSAVMTCSGQSRVRLACGMDYEAVADDEDAYTDEGINGSGRHPWYTRYYMTNCDYEHGRQVRGGPSRVSDVNYT